MTPTRRIDRRTNRHRRNHHGYGSKIFGHCHRKRCGHCAGRPYNRRHLHAIVAGRSDTLLEDPLRYCTTPGAISSLLLSCRQTCYAWRCVFGRLSRRGRIWPSSCRWVVVRCDRSTQIPAVEIQTARLGAVGTEHSVTTGRIQETEFH